MKNISFLRNGKEFKPTKKQLKIVLDDYALMLIKKTKENQELKDHFAEFEDFIEEQGFESLEELKCNIECLKEEVEWGKFNYNELFKSREELYKETQALKDRWEKLKDFIDTFKECNIDEANLAWKILDKMQELELADLIREKEK